jgi:hypothetical protein
VFKIPRILPQSMIEEIEERMAQRRHNRDKLRRYVLNNFIFCARCGRSLTGQTQKDGRTYYTHPRRKDQGCKPGYKIVPGGGIENAVFKTLYRHTFDVESFRGAVAEQAPDDTVIKSLKDDIEYNEKYLEKVEKKLDDLVEIALKKTLKEETIQKKETELRKMKKQAEEELEADRKKLDSMPRLKDFEKQAKAIRKTLLNRFQSLEHMEKMTFKQKRRLLQYLFDGRDPDGKKYGIYVWMKKKINKHKKHFSFDVYAQIFTGYGGFYTRNLDGLDFHERMDKRMAEWSKKQGKPSIKKLTKEEKKQQEKGKNKYKTNLSSFG